MSSVAASLNAGLEGRHPDPNAVLKCQHIGCDATYTEATNPPGCCVFHPGAPVFHDGMKEWSCCKARSHDFGLFMDIKGCATGQHSQEKPELPQPKRPAAPPVQSIPAAREALAAASASADSEKADKPACSRCAQGFFCADHQGPAGVKVAGFMEHNPPPKPAPKPAAAVDPNELQLCKHKSCGLKFKECENHDKACKYHPGPPVFHDRKKGWACCDVHGFDFDEFLSIPPCTLGRHSAVEE